MSLSTMHRRERLAPPQPGSKAAARLLLDGCSTCRREGKARPRHRTTHNNNNNNNAASQRGDFLSPPSAPYYEQTSM